MAGSRMGDKPWTEIIIKFGVPAAIAVYLVWILAGDVKTDISFIKGQIGGHVTSSEHQTLILQRMLQISQEQCISQAVTAKRDPKECLK